MPTGLSQVLGDPDKCQNYGRARSHIPEEQKGDKERNKLIKDASEKFG